MKMNVTNAEFAILERAMNLRPKNDKFFALPQEQQEIRIAADATLLRLLKKKKRNLELTKERMKKRRLEKKGA